MRHGLAILSAAAMLAGCGSDASDDSSEDAVAAADEGDDAAPAPASEESYHRAIECAAVFGGLQQLLGRVEENTEGEMATQVHETREQFGQAFNAVLMRIQQMAPQLDMTEDEVSSDALEAGQDLGSELREQHGEDGDEILMDMMDRARGCTSDASMIMGSVPPPEAQP